MKNGNANNYGNAQYRKFSKLSAFAAGLLMPLLLLAFVPILRNLAHGEPGGWVGFRTQLSTASVANWQLAQRLAANHFLILGIGFLVIAAVVYTLLFRNARDNSKAWAWFSFGLLALQMMALGVSAYLIERSLPPVTGFVPAAIESNWGLPTFFGLLTPVALIACGPFMHHLATKDPNFVSGYRTPGSLQSQKHWQVANSMAGDVSLWVGIVSTVLALIAFGWLLLNGEHYQITWWNLSLFFALAPLVPFVGAIPFIEARLKRLN